MVTAVLLVPLVVGARGAYAAAGPAVLHVGTVMRQDLPSRASSEPDTVVEPDVAVSPVNADVAVAASHDSRFPDGGAVGISSAWTQDGGASWHHAPVPGIVVATGGPYQRASDPVVAFGPDGTAYLSVLLFDIRDCRDAVAVLRSSDGGRTWSAPSYADASPGCNSEEDKNWIVVDMSAASPHYGRVYQFWTQFLFSGTKFLGAPQVVRWSDDRGTTWSDKATVSPTDRGTQNSQPMVLADGTLVDAYEDFGQGAAPDEAPEGRPAVAATTAATAAAPLAATAAAPLAAPLAVDPRLPIVTAGSTDGGRTWQPLGTVTRRGGGYAPGVRCCLFSATVDAATQVMHVAWLDGGPDSTDPVTTSSSRNGRTWSPPVTVSRGDRGGVQRVNVDVSALAGQVFVSYGTRTQPGAPGGGFVQQQLSVSNDNGRTFPAAPLSLGQPSDLTYAAQARGIFPGDYIGSALTRGRLYLVWARSSAPPPRSSSSPYHQVIDGATLAP